jgi:hypothetical protein
MGSTFAPAIANFYMKSEQEVINLGAKKPAYRYRYVDDTSVVWTHGKEEMQIFLQYPNSIHLKAKFTMEAEQNYALLSLDVLMSGRSDGSLGHTVHRKPIHMSLHLYMRSEHHLTHKQAELKMLILNAHRAKTVYDAESLHEEINHLKRTFRQNGYSHLEVAWALIPRQRLQRHKKKLANMATIPFQPMISHKISRLLARHDIKPVHIKVKKNINLLRPVKNNLGPNISGALCIHCGCSMVYVGQTGRTFEARYQEHMRHIQLSQPDESATAEHKFKTGHNTV